MVMGRRAGGNGGSSPQTFPPQAAWLSYLQDNSDEPLLLQSTGVPQQELYGLLHAWPVLGVVTVG